jgi:ABC-2 type transport system ATP-binding protein
MPITETQTNSKNNNTSKIFVEVSNHEEAMYLLMKRGYKVKQEKTRLIVMGENLTPEKLCKELVLIGFDVHYLAQE